MGCLCYLSFFTPMSAEAGRAGSGELVSLSLPLIPRSPPFPNWELCNRCDVGYRHLAVKNLTFGSSQ